MLYTIAAVILALWLLGFALDLVGGVIHVLLVVAAVMFIYQMVTGKRGAPGPGA